MSKKSDEDLHREIMQRADEAHIHDLENRAEGLDDLRFAVGGDYQWDMQLLQDRRINGQPCESINQIPQFIHQVENDARANKPSIKVRGVDDESDPETADVLEGIVRHIEDQSEAVATAYIPGIKNAATCGIGYWRVITDYVDDDTFGQDIFIEGIPNVMAVLTDPMAKKATREDARFWFVFDDIPEDEYKERWPDKPITDFGTGIDWAFWSNRVSKTIRIAEYWCKEPVEKTLGLTADGKTIDLTDIPHPSHKFIGIKDTRKVEGHKICQYLVSGSGILEGPNEWKGRYIPLIALIGEEIWVGDKRIRKSIVRDAKAVQRLYNIWRNAQTEQIAMQPKSPIMATAKQLEKYKDVWKLANRRNFPYLPYDHDGEAPIPQRIQPPQISSGLSEAVALTLQELRGVTGIYDAALGRQSNETSGVAIQNRQRESDTANAHFPDNLALSIRHTGRILIDLIPWYYDTERVVRLLNEDGTEKYQKINAQVMTGQGPQMMHDLSAGRYDVTVKTGPSYQTRRQEAADFLLQFLQTAPESAQFIMDILCKNLDAPGAEELAKRFRLLLAKSHPELVEQNSEDPPPPPSPADQQNALMASLNARLEEGRARLAEAQAEDAEADAALKSVQVAHLATAGPMDQIAERAVMGALQRLLGGVVPQSATQGPTPGNGAGMGPASQPQPMSA